MGRNGRTKYHEEGKTMETATAKKNRIKQRYEVNLKAEVSLTVQKNQEHQCRITNLSASGACVHFESTIAAKDGMTMSIKIFIPATIMHIPNSGEIMWVKQQNNKTSIGVRFQDILSEIMMQQLIKQGSPASPYTPQ